MPRANQEQSNIATTGTPSDTSGMIFIEARDVMQVRAGYSRYKRDTDTKDEAGIELTPGQPLLALSTDQAAKAMLGLISLYDSTYVSEHKERELFEARQRQDPSVDHFFVDFKDQRNTLAMQVKTIGKSVLRAWPEDIALQDTEVIQRLREEFPRFTS